jgi:diguanylate cyclase (GGDEF)-like protein
MAAAGVRVKLQILLGILGGGAAAALGVLSLLREARRTRRAEAALRRREAQVRGALDASVDAFFIFRAQHDAGAAIVDFEIVDCNAPAGRLAGVRVDHLVGRTLTRVFPTAVEKGLLGLFRRVVDSRRPASLEYESDAAGAPNRWLKLQVVHVGDGVAVTARDVTLERHAVDALRAEAQVDELTGLLNRRGFMAAAEGEWRRARHDGRAVVATYLDLNDFKAINDTHGHGEGDAVLRAVAGVLRHAFRGADVIGRLGGDEFAVLVVPGGAGGAGADPAAVERQLRGRIEAQLAHVNAAARAAGRPYDIGIGVGTAAAPAGAPDAARRRRSRRCSPSPTSGSTWTSARAARRPSAWSRPSSDRSRTRARRRGGPPLRGRAAERA